MTRFSPLRSVLFASSIALALIGCSDDKVSPITFFDSGVPDAKPKPDAEVCTKTVCDGECVDTTSDSLHCGGCGMACTSPGQICSGSLPCACPEPFLAASIGSMGINNVQGPGENPGLATNIGIGAVTTAISIGYTLELETGKEYNLADTAANAAPPFVLAAYDVDLQEQSVQTPYIAFEGTITFSDICATGLAGVISSPVFKEITATQPPTLVENGCTMEVETVEFQIGSCEVLVDAGPTVDAGPLPDAGPKEPPPQP